MDVEPPVLPRPGGSESVSDTRCVHLAAAEKVGDADGSGTIDKDEFKKLCEHLSKSREVDMVAAERAFAQARRHDVIFAAVVRRARRARAGGGGRRRSVGVFARRAVFGGVRVVARGRAALLFLVRSIEGHRPSFGGVRAAATRRGGAACVCACVFAACVSLQADKDGSGDVDFEELQAWLQMMQATGGLRGGGLRGVRLRGGRVDAAAGSGLGLGGLGLGSLAGECPAIGGECGGPAARWPYTSCPATILAGTGSAAGRPQRHSRNA